MGASRPLPCPAHLLERIEGLGGHVFVFRALCCPLQNVLEGGVGSMRQAMASPRAPARPWVPAQKGLWRFTVASPWPSPHCCLCPAGTSTSILRRVILWNGRMRKEVRGRRWHTGDSSRRARMPGNLGFSRLEVGEGPGVTVGSELLGSMTQPPRGSSGAFSAHPSCTRVTEPFTGTPSLTGHPSAPSPPRLLPPRTSLSSPLPEAPALQQALVGALLVGLVGDVGQVDPAEGRAVVQHNVTHAEAQDICLQSLLQVLQEPEGSARGQRQGETPGLGAAPISSPPPTRPGQSLTSRWCS